MKKILVPFFTITSLSFAPQAVSAESSTVAVSVNVAQVVNFNIAATSANLSISSPITSANSTLTVATYSLERSASSKNFRLSVTGSNSSGNQLNLVSPNNDVLNVTSISLGTIVSSNDGLMDISGGNTQTSPINGTSDINIPNGAITLTLAPKSGSITAGDYSNNYTITLADDS